MKGRKGVDRKGRWRVRDGREGERMKVKGRRRVEGRKRGNEGVR